MAAAGPAVTFAEDGTLAVVTLARPEEGNRLTPGAFEDLLRTLDGPLTGHRHTVLLLRAEGRDFSLGRVPAAGPTPTAEVLQEEFRRVQRVNEALARFPGISIAAVQGRAFGAGASLAGRCDLVLAAEDARFAFPEVLHGIAPTIVMSYYAKLLPRKAFADLVLTGRDVGAEEARQIGLVSRVVPASDLQQRARALADELLGREARVLWTIKRFLGRVDRLAYEDAADYGIALLANLQASR